MTADLGRGRLGRVDAPAEPRAGSPAVAITVAAGLVGLLLSLSSGGFALALFLGLTSLAAQPMALSDRPGAKGVQMALLGAAMGLLALVLVLVPLLTGDQQRADRRQDPGRSQDAPSLPRASAPAAPSAS